MAFVLKIAFVSSCLSGLAVCVSGNQGPYEIVRDKYDTFRNLECHTETCTSEQCQRYNAECKDKHQCKFCRCQKGRSTFLEHHSNCTKDEEIVPESVPENSFILEYKKYKMCLTVEGSENDKVVGKSCSSSLDMRWIFTKVNETTLQFRLVNVATLQCLEFTNTNQSNITMAHCSQRKGQNIRTGTGTIYVKYIQNYFLDLLKGHDNRYFAASGEHSKNTSYRWMNIGDTFKRAEISYEGCYRFQDERFMVYLDNDTCSTNACSRKFSAPIFGNNTECDVKWLKSTIMFSDGRWKNIPNNIDIESLMSVENSANKSVKILKVKQRAFHVFSGDLLKLEISCGKKSETKYSEKHCLLLKFKGKYLQKNKVTTPTPQSERTKTSTNEITARPTSRLLQDTTEDTEHTTNKIHQKDGDTSSITTLAIVVPFCLLVVILVLIFIYYLSYRKRKRAQKQFKGEGTDLNNPNYSKPDYEDPNRAYEMPASSIPTASSPAKYEYIDNNEIAKPKQRQPELKYDYAANTEIPRINLDALQGEEGKNSPGNIYQDPEAANPQQGAVYSTLEEPTEETNPLARKTYVGHDAAHSGDPVYKTLEESSETN